MAGMGEAGMKLLKELQVSGHLLEGFNEDLVRQVLFRGKYTGIMQH